MKKKESEEKFVDYFNISSKTVINYNKFYSNEQKRIFFKWVKAGSKIIGLKTSMKKRLGS